MKTTHLFSVTFAMSVLSSHAQIVEIGPTDYACYLVQTLVSGEKYLSRPYYPLLPTGFTLLNTDLTIYQSVTYATPPPGYDGEENRNANWITESLFDTDPSTIEYVRHLAPTDPFALCTSTGIYRDDGTLLYFFEEGAITEIWNTPSGARMIVRPCHPDSLAKVFALPGSLPCVACDGTITPMSMMLGGQDELMPDGGIQAFPNPAADQATISYTLPEGTEHATLVLSTLNGSVVSRMAITGSGTRIITTADLAAGTYLYHVESDHGMIGAKRLVVVK